MLKKPRHFPVYIASSLFGGNIDKEISIVSKISTSKSKGAKNRLKKLASNSAITTLEYWDGIGVYIESICYSNITMYSAYNCPANTILALDAKLVAKDEWIKAINDANKAIDERNKKEGTKIKRIPY